MRQLIDIKPFMAMKSTTIIDCWLGTFGKLIKTIPISVSEQINNGTEKITKFKFPNVPI